MRGNGLNDGIRVLIWRASVRCVRGVEIIPDLSRGDFRWKEMLKLGFGICCTVPVFRAFVEAIKSWRYCTIFVSFFPRELVAARCFVDDTRMLG